MLKYLFQRFIFMIFMLLLISVGAFVVIQLPPGDYITSYVASLTADGTVVSAEEVAAMRRNYGLDLPWYGQYFKWIGKIFQGDFGRSFAWDRPVSELLAERMPMTAFILVLTLIFTNVIAIPIGIYVATHQYKFGDYFFTVLGFIGLATPGFLMALILMVLLYQAFGLSIGGLFSPMFVEASWSWTKVWDLIKHLPTPIIVVGLNGTAGTLRMMRGSLLDELKKQYVITARAKGVEEKTLLLKYPVRIALNPIISNLGTQLPGIVSQATVVDIVLNLPTAGPLLFQALLSQDMFLAGAIVMILSCLTVAGMFFSDILLAIVDPRIKLDK